MLCPLGTAARHSSDNATFSHHLTTIENCACCAAPISRKVQIELLLDNTCFMTDQIHSVEKGTCCLAGRPSCSRGTAGQSLETAATCRHQGRHSCCQSTSWTVRCCAGSSTLLWPCMSATSSCAPWPRLWRPRRGCCSPAPAEVWSLLLGQAASSATSLLTTYFADSGNIHELQVVTRLLIRVLTDLLAPWHVIECVVFEGAWCTMLSRYSENELFMPPVLSTTYFWHARQWVCP